MMNLGMILNCSIEIDKVVPAFTSSIMTLVKIFIPIILIAYGMIDLAKAVMANDDKVMKEAQNKLIHRIIYAVVIFFVVAIVQLVFGMLADAGDDTTGKADVTQCIDCFLNNNSCYAPTTSSESNR